MSGAKSKNRKQLDKIYIIVYNLAWLADSYLISAVNSRNESELISLKPLIDTLITQTINSK